MYVQSVQRATNVLEESFKETTKKCIQYIIFNPCLNIPLIHYLQILSIFLIMGMFTSMSSSGLEEYILLEMAGMTWLALVKDTECLSNVLSFVEGDMVEVEVLQFCEFF